MNPRFLLSFLILIVTLFSCAPPDDLEKAPIVNAEPPTFFNEAANVSSCTPCPNNLSVILHGGTSGDNACLNVETSGVLYENSSGISIVNFQSVPNVGYSAFLPFNDVCSGSQIAVTLCKYPPILDLCNYEVFSYKCYVSWTGGGPEEILISEAVDSSGCASVLLGTFTTGGTSNCEFSP